MALLTLWLKFAWSVVWGTVCALFSCCFSRRGSGVPDLSADVCVVTGAGQGLGRHLALQLAECGATLVLWDINEEKVHAVAREIRERGGEAHSYVVDCSEREEVYRAAATVREKIGDVAVLINNAGISYVASYVDGNVTDEQIVKTFSVNALALYWTVRAFLPWMMENDYGYIVNIASLSAQFGCPFVAPYAATKAAVKSFSESLRYELLLHGKRGISVSCAYPSFMDTDMLDSGLGEAMKAKGATISQPAEVARAVLRGMGDKRREVFVHSSEKLVAFLKMIVPDSAFEMLSSEAGAIIMTHQKKKE